MTIDTKLSLERELVTSFSKQTGEPDWLQELRQQAYDSIEELPMPTPDKTKITNWNLTQFDEHTVASNPYDSLEELPEQVKLLVADISNESNLQNIYIQRNNVPSYLKLDSQLAEQGVIFTDIFSAAQNHSSLLEKYYMTKGVKVDENRLTALHAALMNGGVFLYVPKNVVIEEPIQAVFVHDDEKATLFNHVIVVAEDNSSVTYVENYISTVNVDNGITNLIAEVYAKGNATVHYGAVDQLAEGYTSYINRRGIAEKDANIEWALGLMNDGSAVYENDTHLVGDGSYATSKTVVVGRGPQTENFTTRIIHHGKHTTGFILNHGVMQDSSTAIFNGIGQIENGAQRSDAVQETRVLMLSEKARGDANPILLIEEDDVTAGHAASVGKVDPMQLYYLMSRGIPEDQAERLIIHGFLSPVVNDIPIETVRKQLTELIERKIS